MGFNYHRNKDHGAGDSTWASYSDLFLGLSIIFLLLFVSASLKQGTDGIQQQMEQQRLAKEAEDLKQQIKVYETLKQNYLEKQASNDEKDNYEELMGKLSLLQEEARDEKDKLQQQARENEKKAQALNKYQQMIRNIINTNVLAKARIKDRDTLIETQDVEITEKTQEISNLHQSVAEKSAEIEKGEERIETLESQLDKRMAQLRSAYKSQKISKKKFEEQQAIIKKEAEGRIAALREANAKAQAELDLASRELKETESRLAETEGQVAKLGQEKTQLEGALANAKGKHKEELEGLRGEYESQQARDRAAFDAALAKEKLTGAQKAAREAAFKAEAEQKARALGDQISALDKKYRDTRGELAKAQENLNARKNLANQIKKNFGAKGVKAEVDDKTGDVLLSFGDEYFATGQAHLKPKMRQILEQTMPTYAASLFEDTKVAQKIQSVEIVGFASPTYKGKFVDPKKLDPETRQAVNYNLDLSYARARSIFNHVFDREKMAFKHQERLLPLVKVTGRSFLSNTDKKGRDPASYGSAEEFCQVNDCAKLQRVIIKFTLKD